VVNWPNTWHSDCNVSLDSNISVSMAKSIPVRCKVIWCTRWCYSVSLKKNNNNVSHKLSKTMAASLRTTILQTIFIRIYCYLSRDSVLVVYQSSCTMLACRLTPENFRTLRSQTCVIKERSTTKESMSIWML